MLDEVEALTGNVRVLGATAYLRRRARHWMRAGYGDRIMMRPPGLVHEMDYYTAASCSATISAVRARRFSQAAVTTRCAKFGKGYARGRFGIDVESVADGLQDRAVPRSHDPP